MVNLTIDGKQVQVKENTTILEAARAAGIHVPSLCYLKDINEIGACRVCVVEVIRPISSGEFPYISATFNRVSFTFALSFLLPRFGTGVR